ncbi:MAG TPA: hypothetical protein VKC66_20675 [Xanthobacteraceae bacterium]|nr:hypothetical protein [Xanthobacteraceae bacterium]
MVEKQHISDALSRHHMRVACLLVETTVLMFDLFDVQSPVVIEALIDEVKRRRRTGPKSREGVREAFIEYAEGVLQTARARERRLYERITGKED